MIIQYIHTTNDGIPLSCCFDYYHWRACLDTKPHGYYGDVVLEAVYIFEESDNE